MLLIEMISDIIHLNHAH